MAIRKEQRITYEEWRETDFGENTRSELIDGRIYMMSAPSRRHQEILGSMFGQLYNHLRGKSCKVYLSPFAVRLSDDTEVLPDLVVVCDTKKLTTAGMAGSPDLVVEILSPSTSSYDKFTKFTLYLQSGVPEYWIVDPTDSTVTAFRLAGNSYTATIFTEAGPATINALPGFEMDLSAVFAEE